jgi:AraC-like DNA-binding protein
LVAAAAGEPDGPRRVADYARRLHVSAPHLTAVVTAATGRPPGAHVRAGLALEAKRLLAHTDLTAAGVAARLGFRDPAYFGRFFRREAGESPERFRRRIRGKSQTSRGPSL